jgi:hypothetical protein
MSARGRRRIGPWISTNAPLFGRDKLMNLHRRALAVDADFTDRPGIVGFSTASWLFR